MLLKKLDKPVKILINNFYILIKCINLITVSKKELF